MDELIDTNDFILFLKNIGELCGEGTYYDKVIRGYILLLININ